MNTEPENSKIGRYDISLERVYKEDGEALKDIMATAITGLLSTEGFLDKIFAAGVESKVL